MRSRSYNASVEAYEIRDLKGCNLNLMIADTQVPVVSSPTGSFDLSAGAALEESIKELARENIMHHIIDLRAVTKVDARTIRTMIKINRNMSEIGGSIRLVIENPKALRYIKLTAIERVFRVYPTPDAALAGYASDDRVATTEISSTILTHDSASE